MEYTQETSAWQDYQNGLAWQRSMGFEEKFPLYVRFKEGDQWPPATRRTKNLPRPVFNMVEIKREMLFSSSTTRIFSRIFILPLLLIKADGR